MGDVPETDSFSFRWSAINNLFLTAGDLAADEWRASRSTDEENAEREMRQFVWCLPVVPTKWEETSLEAHELTARIIDVPRGVVPSGFGTVTAAMDLGKFLCHWVVVAWRDSDATGHIVDYGRMEVASEDLGVEQAMLISLRQFRDMALAGWPVGSASGEHVAPNQVWIDSGYLTDVVYAFVREAGERFRPAIGRGAAQQRQQWYNRPTKTGSIVRHIGEGFHMNWLPTQRLYLCEIDADHWKSWVHQRLTTPLETPGALSLFQASSAEHLALAKHLTAEVKTEEFVAGRGVMLKWERLRRQNHWFDALYDACAAGSFCGVRLVEEPAVESPRVVEHVEVDPRFQRMAGQMVELRERMAKYWG